MVEVQLATRAANGQLRTMDQYGIFTEFFNLPSLFFDFSIFVCRYFPNFPQHFSRCPLLSWGNFSLDNLFIEITYRSESFMYKFSFAFLTVGSVPLITTSRGAKSGLYCRFDWLKKNRTIPLRNFSANGIFRPNHRKKTL